MLISQLQRLRERLVFLKLYFAERHEQEKRLMPRMLYWSYSSRFALADSKAAILQRRLSILGSEVCSMLVYWDEQNLRAEYEREIQALISEIRLSKDLESVESLLSQPLNKMDFRVQANISIWLQIYRAGIRHYCGATPNSDDPMVKVIEIQKGIDQIRKTKIQDPASLNALVALLDRRELFDFKAAESTTFFRGRLN